MEWLVRKVLSLQGLAEDRVWTEMLAPSLKGMPSNVIEICQYVTTEIINNAIDHSEGTTVTIYMRIDDISDRIKFVVIDNGVGIFKKIMGALELEHAREAILELHKGGVTTDPARHTGEGIFFSSRACNRFMIVSQGLVFSGSPSSDLITEDVEASEILGTAVLMAVEMDTETTLKEVFDAYAVADHDFAFTKTVIPVALAKNGGGGLVSRSQAKRIMAGTNRFKEVLLDFDEVDQIGQAFADEIFRVFQRLHPEVIIGHVNANESVKRMIERAQKRPEFADLVGDLAQQVQGQHRTELDKAQAESERFKNQFARKIFERVIRNTTSLNQLFRGVKYHLEGTYDTGLRRPKDGIAKMNSGDGIKLLDQWFGTLYEAQPIKQLILHAEFDSYIRPGEAKLEILLTATRDDGVFKMMPQFAFAYRGKKRKFGVDILEMPADNVDKSKIQVWLDDVFDAIYDKLKVLASPEG